MAVTGSVPIKTKRTHVAVYSVFRDSSKQIQVEDVNVKATTVNGVDQIVNVNQQLH